MYRNIFRKIDYKKYLIGSTLWGVGDFVSQKVTKNNTESIDYKRVFRSAFYGGCIYTPIANKWYTVLEKLIPGNTKIILGKKLILDQTLWCSFILSLTYASFAVLEGNSLTVAKNRICKEVPSSMLANWCVWVPTQALNFKYIQPHNRVYLVNLVTVPWSGYLAWKNSKS